MRCSNVVVGIEGIIVKCENESDPGFKTCSRCREHNKKYNKKYRTKNIKRCREYVNNAYKAKKFRPDFIADPSLLPKKPPGKGG